MSLCGLSSNLVFPSRWGESGASLLPSVGRFSFSFFVSTLLFRGVLLELFLREQTSIGKILGTYMVQCDRSFTCMVAGASVRRLL